METFSSASHLKGPVLENLPPDLLPLRNIISDHLQGPHRELGGLAGNASGQSQSRNWRPILASGDDACRVVPPDVLAGLRTAMPDDPPGPTQIACTALVKSGMRFSIFTKSSRDSQISYRGLSGDIRFGRIFAILSEPTTVGGQESIAPRIWIIVERYESLGPADLAKDVYRTHPLLGQNGYSLAQMMYDAFALELEIIRPRQIVGHIARCSLEQGSVGTFAEPVFVAVQLDRVRHGSHLPLPSVDTFR